MPNAQKQENSCVFFCPFVCGGSKLKDPEGCGFTVAQVPALAGSAPLPVEIRVVLAELHGASGLSPRSKRLLAALIEAAAFELAPSATAHRLRRAAFWGKVRVAVLAGTLAAVVAVDMALAAYLYARRANDRYHVLPPT